MRTHTSHLRQGKRGPDYGRVNAALINELLTCATERDSATERATAAAYVARGLRLELIAARKRIAQLEGAA